MTSPGSARPRLARAAAGALPDVDAATAGYRAPLRWDGDVCWVVDQRRLPDVLSDSRCAGAADAVTAINDGAIVGGAVQAQLAAVTLALVAARVGDVEAVRPPGDDPRGGQRAAPDARPGSAAVAR